jgi:hypothetical protein
MTREETLQLLALCEALPKGALAQLLDRQLFISGMIIDPYPETFLKVSRSEKQQAGDDFEDLITALPCALRELLQLQDELAEHVGFLGVMDTAGVTMNGMTPTEALAKLRQIAGGRGSSA